MEIEEKVMSEDKNIESVNKIVKDKMTEVYILGTKFGLKTAAEMIKYELKTPEEWAKMSSDELIDLIIHAVAKSNEIINGIDATTKDDSESQSEK